MKVASPLSNTILVLTLSACGTETGSQQDAPATLAADPLTADLTFLREEEKLARDVYLTLYERWQLAPHQNIAASEQTHTDRVKTTLTSFELPDPVVDDSVGAFVNADLAGLYLALIERGLASEQAALEVGATIEDLDIRDLEQMRGRTDDPVALALYEALECGSRNHLRSFTAQLTTRGVAYQPQYLGQSSYEAILAGAHERCSLAP